MQSRNQARNFLIANPQASLIPTLLPPSLLLIVSDSNWILLQYPVSFVEKLKEVISHAQSLAFT